jgi:hypothetical protein
MPYKSLRLIAMGTVLAVLGNNVLAQDVHDHPRVNEVTQRLDNQQTRVDQGLADGKMSGREASRDEAHDADIAKRESVDEAKHGGHLTQGEQRRLNRSLNKNSRRVYKQTH